ncbi:FAD-dependent oxidoreductase, partial [Klebsiella pneumoniae]|uniref:FAD-dependent oxidoreductase n=1 Tax=Klebsiella pneumoniae TaxID=573 RepID=UPI003851CDEC
HLVRKQKNVTTLLGSVVGVNAQAKRIMMDGEELIAFDTLILATGARHAYFGHDEWEPYAPGLKTLEDATKIRRRILSAFEQAEWETDPAER